MMTVGSQIGTEAIVACRVVAEANRAWLRLRVCNKRRRLAAEEVQIRVTDIRQLKARPNAPSPPRLSPGGLPLIWSNTAEITTGLVPPGAQQPVDLGYPDKAADESYSVPLVLSVHPPPADNRHMLGSLESEIGLTVTARNADPSDYRVVVFCDGSWGDDPWEHLKIKSVSRVRVRA